MASAETGTPRDGDGGRAGPGDLDHDFVDDRRAVLGVDDERTCGRVREAAGAGGARRAGQELNQIAIRRQQAAPDQAQRESESGDSSLRHAAILSRAVVCERCGRTSPRGSIEGRSAKPE